jgi:prepilin-type N-terminal cleavage/methylation domain-containing protein
MQLVKSKGLTLVEVLIVLAIMSILFSILLPVLSKVLRRAREYDERAYVSRSQPLLTVKNTGGIEMGLGFYKSSGEPILYCDDEKAKNTQMIQHVFGFMRLEDYVKSNRNAFARPDRLTDHECDLLRGCGFVEWKAWESGEA